MVRRFAALTFAILLLLGGSLPAWGTVFTSARMVGTSGALSADGRGPDAAFINPANLAYWGDRSLRVRLLSLSGGVSNNSFSIGDYNSYTGSELSEEDKTDIIGKIPAGGLTVDGEVVAAALAVAWKDYALVFSGLGAAHGKFSKDYFELLLYGNELDRTYSIDDTEGEAYLASVLSLCGSRIVRTTASDTLSLGLTLKWLRGFLYGGSSQVEGGITFHDYSFEAAGTAAALKSEGGSGFAFDFGASYKLKESWSFSASFLNIGGLKWTEEVEEKIFTFRADSLRLYDDRDTLDDIGTDTTIYGGSFKSKLPAKMILATAWKYADRVRLGLSWEQGFRKGPAVSKTLYLALGGEYYPTRWLPLRAGLGLGGYLGVFGSFGFGIEFPGFSLDFALANRGVFRAKGVAFALTMDVFM